MPGCQGNTLAAGSQPTCLPLGDISKYQRKSRGLRFVKRVQLTFLEGVTAKTFTTSGLLHHLKSKHPDKYAEYDQITSAQKKKLLAKDITAISFTTDIWSSDVSITSMLSLTAQWIDKDFKLQKILLHSQEFR
ncbi:hypothetical protein F7725_002795, partial [Dissostichus mawsoni]